EARSLHPLPEEAALVQRIFERYLTLGSVVKLKAELDGAVIRSPERRHRNGRSTGGHPFSRGKLYVMLQNPIFIGRIRHRELVHPGQHQAVVDEALWHAVQDQLAAHRRKRPEQRGARAPSPLAGRLFDPEGRKMRPSHANKKGRCATVSDPHGSWPGVPLHPRGNDLAARACGFGGYRPPAVQPSRRAPLYRCAALPTARHVAGARHSRRRDPARDHRGAVAAAMACRDRAGLILPLPTGRRRSGSGVDSTYSALRPVRDHREPGPHHRGDARTDRHQLSRDPLGRPARRSR
ncbi:MAG: recombinase family protein, partial [Rhodobacteraceae bacterium]|nr:recombinase family protein [Paracoccaceae bacterium]